MQAKDELERRRSALSTKKQALLEKIVSRKANHVAQPVSIPRRPAELREIAPASFSQQRIWFLEQLEPGTSTYNFSEAWPLKGSLSYQALQQSFTEIVRRHAVLRTTFVEIAGKPMQRINGATPLALPVADLRSLPESERAQAARRLLNEAAQTPFDLQQGPLLRPFLVQLAPQDYILLVSIHHIASDGWSMGIINRELSVLYNALSNGQPSPLPALPIQYADYAVWQRDWLKGETLERQLTYWKKQLAEAPALLALPTNRPRPARQSYQGHTLTFALSRSLLDQLYQLSRSEGVTLFMLLIAAFQALLARYTQQEDLAVGSLIANRRYAEIEPLVGFFVNTLVLRVDLSGNPTFQEFLKRVRDVTLEAYDHQDVPFERIVEAIQPERNLSYNPLFQVLFVLQSGLGEAMSLGNMNRMAMPVENNTAPFDLTFDLGETATGLRGSLRYNSDIFDRETMEQLIEHFRILLTGILAQPDACIWEIPLLTEEERQQMLFESSGAGLSSLQEPDFLDLFAAQVRRSPQAIAACSDGVQASYQHLDARATFLADQLATLGVGSESRVAVIDRRGLPLLAALLAIFKV
ncbi:MAG TPA: condensation domain-containing protein, partial [Ktedonobacteraceae bacterium]